MGNTVTGQLEKIGVSLAQRSLREQWRGQATVRSTRRLDFFATELKATRATYNDYLVGVGEFKQSWREGLLGKDVAGAAFIGTTAVLMFFAGRTIGHGSLFPLEAPFHKYPDPDGKSDFGHH